ncbi:hypothetical protein DICSQDRAFT_67235 [Dichomitus squalens LYAD-421 SS1]|uniref:Endonuclease/exonuclease/phosphatase domain-containing protein n=1 Tax=Dichomitus squalens (strain LYAD-421) TaxID=732165 RepID=R7SRE3_DICSQ|nr:uncharacterized protein DICSQDRAFT_67235 [Dichomitus squalens LYAD-421 SS1]EJF58325.1 hypothetical protein DICSQDRAFT_67235 [Dichomitus squalens LYAD-421 SS1]
MALPAGIPTLEASRTKNLTRSDNVFCSTDLIESLRSCKTAPHLRPTKTDHFPIHTIFDLPLACSVLPLRRNFRDVDWKAFNTALRVALQDSALPEEIQTTDDFDRTLSLLMKAINRAVEKEVPYSRPSPFSKRWWSKELAAMRKIKQRLGCIAHKHRHL